MTIRDFLQALRAGRYIIVAAVVIVLAAAVVMLMRQETVYQSRAVVQLASADDGGATGATFAVNADLGAVRSSDVVETATATLNEEGIDPVPAANVNAEFASDDQVRIFVTAPSQEQAQANANAFAAAFVTEIGTGMAEQIADLDARRDLLRTQLATVEAQLALQPADPLAGAEREAIIEQYQSLSAQMSVAQSIVAPGQLVELAQGASDQGVSEPVVLGVALLAGLVAGIGLALVRRAFDTRVQDGEEAGGLASTDVLADLYGAKPADRESQKSGVLPVARRAATPFTEAIRQLRTTTQVAAGRSSHAVVAVTTADRSAPREFITANLAASFALSGRPTIVVRGDLRRNALAKLLPFNEDSELVAGEITPTTIPNLSYYELPESALDPADFLATQQVRALLAGLRDEAEIVVVDAPPVLAAADATIIGGQVDGVVLIASAARTHRVVLAEAADRLRKNHVTLLGLALTGVRADRALMSASTYGDTDSTHSRRHARADGVTVQQVVQSSDSDAISSASDEPQHDAADHIDDASEVAQRTSDDPSEVLEPDEDDQGNAHGPGDADDAGNAQDVVDTADRDSARDADQPNSESDEHTATGNESAGAAQDGESASASLDGMPAQLGSSEHLECSDERASAADVKVAHR